MAEPHYYPTRDGWYIWVKNDKGKFVRKFLAKTKKQAFEVWKASIRAGDAILRGDPIFSTVATKWLERQYQRRDREEVSAAWIGRVVRTIDKFVADNPKMTCSQITPAAARAWLPKGCSAAYEHTELSTIKQVLKWAVSEAKLIAHSPLADLKLSKGKRRETIITIEQHREIARPPFVWSADATGRRIEYKPKAESSLRMLLWFAWWTGARPGELRLLDWSHLDDDCNMAVLRDHKTAGATGRARVIYFNPLAQSILKRHRKPEGPVFTTSRGNRWSKDELVRRVGVIQDRTGIDVTAYAYRHSFITRALIAGEDAATVAEFTGTSIEMISRHYGHLDKAKSHLSGLASRLR